MSLFYTKDGRKIFKSIFNMEWDDNSMRVTIRLLHSNAILNALKVSNKI